MYSGRPTGPGGLPPNMPPGQSNLAPGQGMPPGQGSMAPGSMAPGGGSMPPVQSPLGLGFGQGVLSQTLQSYGGKLLEFNCSTR